MGVWGAGLCGSSEGPGPGSRGALSSCGKRLHHRCSTHARLPVPSHCQGSRIQQRLEVDPPADLSKGQEEAAWKEVNRFWTWEDKNPSAGLAQRESPAAYLMSSPACVFVLERKLELTRIIKSPPPPAGCEPLGDTPACGRHAGPRALSPVLAMAPRLLLGERGSVLFATRQLSAEALSGRDCVCASGEKVRWGGGDQKQKGKEPRP